MANCFQKSFVIYPSPIHEFPVSHNNICVCTLYMYIYLCCIWDAVWRSPMVLVRVHIHTLGRKEFSVVPGT